MLQVNYHENFKGAPTLLLAGTKSDIEALRDLFGTWTGERVDLVKYFGKTGINLAGMREMVLNHSSTGPNSVVRVNDDSCQWRVSKSWKKRIMGLLQALIESQSPSHQYLDSGEGAVQVLCSKDEYEPESPASFPHT